MLKEVAYSPDIIWISYGAEQYDPLKFKPIDYTDPGAVLNNKPWGGLWACPENDILSWHNWCKSENYFTNSLNKSFKFKLKPKAKIYVIDTEEDLVNISTSLRYGFMVGQGYYCIDFERLLREGYDGIYVTDNAVIKLRRTCGKNENVIGLKSWDVESLCVFNPDVIVPVTENKVTITESEVDNIIKIVLNEYLDKNLMNPLYKYLKRYGKKYDQDEFARRYYQYTNYLKGYPLTTAHAFQEPEVFKNGWVVHFTNNPYQILKNGFKGVRSEYLKSLWRTYGRGYEQSEEGYCFAYDANDNIPKNAIEYGEYGLVFRVSGLKVKNLGDLGEKQVVFNSKMANLKECYIIIQECDTRSDYDGNGDIETIKTLTGISVINPVTKKKLYVSKTIGGALQWIQTNYRQYSSANVSKIIPSLKKADKQNEQIVNGLIEYVKSWVKDLVIWDDNDVRYQTVHLIYTGSLNNYMEQLYKLADMRKKYENDIEINLKYMQEPVFYDSAMRWVKEHGIQERNPMKLYQMAKEYNIHEIIITRNK